MKRKFVTTPGPFSALFHANQCVLSPEVSSSCLCSRPTSYPGFSRENLVTRLVDGLFATLQTRRKLGRVNFRKDVWDFC